jgi:hypothetical protein
MKPKSSVVLMTLLVLCAGALIAACHLPGGPPSTKGSLKITIGNNIAARTIVPPTEGTTATLYEVNGAGPNGAKFSTQTSGDPVTISGLALGQWTVSVDALNANADTIGHGESSATVAAGENSVTVSVLLASGSGNLSLTVNWNTGQVQGPGSVGASITPARGGSLQSLSFTGSDGSLSSATTGILPGYYILNLNLLDHAGNVVGSTTDLVWIVNAQTSTGSFDFTNAVNTGSIKVSITPLPNPLNASISRSGGSVSAVVANYSGTDLSYQWYMNGAAVGTNSNNYTLPSTPGCYWISVIVWTTNWAQAGSATANFQVGSSIPWIVGSWGPYIYAPYSDLLVISADGTFCTYNNYDGSGGVGMSGTWTLEGDLLTITLGGDGTAQITVDHVSDNQWSAVESSPGGPPAGTTFYRKGYEPGGSVFSQIPTVLVQGAWTDGTISTHNGMKLFSFTAPSAGSYQVSWKDMSDGGGYTGDVEPAAYRSDENTLIFIDHEGDYPSPQTVSMNADETIYIIIEASYSAGTFSVMVQ